MNCRRLSLGLALFLAIESVPLANELANPRVGADRRGPAARVDTLWPRVGVRHDGGSVRQTGDSV